MILVRLRGQRRVVHNDNMSNVDGLEWLALVQPCMVTTRHGEEARPCGSGVRQRIDCAPCTHENLPSNSLNYRVSRVSQNANRKSLGRSVARNLSKRIHAATLQTSFTTRGRPIREPFLLPPKARKSKTISLLAYLEGSTGDASWCY